tara:strand:+ start:883 stop:1419 length:537 start_codon:yes stop_codon:yes gene_type:complete
MRRRRRFSRVGLKPKCSLCLSRVAKAGRGKKLCVSCAQTFTWSEQIQGFYRKRSVRIPWKGERELEQILGVIFAGEKIVNSFRPIWCKGTKGAPLEYDFYIPERKLLIELNGAQHYAASSWFDGRWGADKKFAERQRNDRLKTEIAERRGLNLVTIKYRWPLLPAYVLKNLQEGGHEG